MSRFLRLFLILSFVLTGVALASARGQIMAGERFVLCSGQAIILTFGDDGTPSESPAYCPDMALALLSAVAVPETQLVLSRSVIDWRAYPVVAIMAGQRAVTAQARDPPVRSL